MQILEKRFETLRRVGGFNSASALLANAASLLGIEKEVLRLEGRFHDQVQLVLQELRADAGHKVTNFLRYKQVLPPLSYRSVLRRACLELGLGVQKSEAADSLEERIVSHFLGSRWKPSSLEHRALLARELTRILRARHKEFGAPLKRILSTTLSLRTITKGKPKWAEQRTAAGLVATGIYAAMKLGEPDLAPRVMPCILVFALVRSEIETSTQRRNEAQAQAIHLSS
jgi:hypothetical protein